MKNGFIKLKAMRDFKNIKSSIYCVCLVVVKLTIISIRSMLYYIFKIYIFFSKIIFCNLKNNCLLKHINLGWLVKKYLQTNFLFGKYVLVRVKMFLNASKFLLWLYYPSPESRSCRARDHLFQSRSRDCVFYFTNISWLDKLIESKW